MVKQAKQERNIHCTLCGKAYFDPVAAKRHAKKHHVRAQLALALVAPQSAAAKPKGRTLLSSDPCPVRLPSSSQHAPPNPSVHMRPSARDIVLNIRQVAAPPVTQSKGTKGSKKRSKVRFRSGKTSEPLEYFTQHDKQVRQRIRKVCHSDLQLEDVEATLALLLIPLLMSPQHTTNGCDIPSNITDRLTKKRAKIAKNKSRLALDYSPMESSDDEGQYTFDYGESLQYEDEDGLRYGDEDCLPYSDDERHLNLEDEHHSSPEDEQPPYPDGKGQQSVWESFIDYLRLYF
ncbi:hypothetical protein BJ322DRAFT_1113333 [Thelephora terrestris]|uniref:Uncharacterized protein n=1 Tax=Thelephora terrestris TaxID=56493 RepID=A0A9P6L271_9AGAM|nr:hypothetical protein BJ322DRAFT_1113333 [Thelephora terrestris]